jgi:twinkle protein
MSRDTGLLHGDYSTLGNRKVPESICKRYNYSIGTDKVGNTCQIATYYDKEYQPVAQKLRYRDKSFKFIGKPKETLLFGQQLFGEGGKTITITEGEIDALSVATAWDGKYPVVSIQNGAQSAKKEISKQLDWISSFDEIILWFDSDEAGRKAIEECVPLFEPGKVKVVTHSSYKDASDVLVAEGKSGIVSTFYNAKEFRPDGIVTAGDIKEDAMKPTEWGDSWCFDGITQATYGRRLGELHLLGAGVGIGKTDFVMAQIAHDITKGKLKVGTFMLEQTPVETLKRIAGKLDGKHYHLPNEDEKVYKNKDLSNTIEKVQQSGNLFMYNSFGAIDWEVIQSKIRVMHHNYGVNYFYLDNITAITAQASDERRFLDSFMEELASLCKELNIWILAISHLTTPGKGASHEEGGRVEAKQFTGSRALQRWAHYMFGLERNNQHIDVDERKKTIFRCLKDRFSGQATGMTWSLRYDSETGLLREVDEEWDSVEAEGEHDNNEDF